MSCAENDPEILELLRGFRKSLDDAMALTEGMDWNTFLAAEGFPDHVKRLIGHWKSGLDSIKSGDYRRGWSILGTAFELFPEHEGSLGLKPEDRWNGEPLNGETLLVHSNGWGAGDTIQFVRYLPMLRAKGARVVLLCEVTLCGVLDTCTGIEEGMAETAFYVAGAPPFRGPYYDYHVSLMALPGIFETTLDTIPADIPYLHVPHEVPGRADLDRLIDHAPGLKIGLACAGSRRHPNDKVRSSTPEVFGALQALPNASLFSFQWGSWEYPTIPGAVPLRDHLHTFASTAHALSKMDLVIGVDSSLIHLAGAMGRPVWVVLPYEAEFRWMEGRSDSPWYPTMRLFRQPSPGDWGSVMGEIISAFNEGARLAS